MTFFSFVLLGLVIARIAWSIIDNTYWQAREYFFKDYGIKYIATWRNKDAKYVFLKIRDAYAYIKIEVENEA